MSKLLKFVLLAIPVFAIGVYSSIKHDESIVDTHFKGVVIQIDWKSKNHGMPLIQVRATTGKVKKFHHYRINLSKSDLKVGDSFEKLKSSRFCLINNKEVECVSKNI
ncbi:MAG: hypothetical protein ABJD02_04275 [Paraglaciecola sp.]|uniref:hypothetical protein n=1 Tax=Paraglaciecola sp. TaxID=1920173 RepID=UPI003264DAF9